MQLERFRSFLQNVSLQSQVAQFESESSEKFSAVVYCKLSGSDYDEQCSSFISKFSTETQTNWISYKRNSRQVRYLFRKTFSCQLARKNKTNKERKTQNNIRDKECKAKIDFKWKLVNRDTCKNDHNLKTGLNCVINIAFDHSHPIVSADAMSYLRCTKDTTKLFYSYFQSGLAPAAAKSFHEIFLTESADDENSTAINLANPQINPTLRQVLYFHETWRRDHQHAVGSTLYSILEKKKDMEKNGYYLGIDGDTLDVAIVTPLMKRVFVELALGDYVVIVESSDSYSQSKVASAMKNLFLTFVFISSKIGALPIACVLQNSHNFQKPLSLLKDTLERATEMTFDPGVIITYDSAVQRTALQTLFPKAKILLSNSGIRQATWKWMTKNKVDCGDQKQIMTWFQKVMRATTADSAIEAFKGLRSMANDNPQAVKYVEKWWFRRSEWCPPFCGDIVSEGISLDDCEACVRVLKDTLLYKCKGFTSPALVDLVCSPIENYHKQRLADFASGLYDRVMSYNSKFCQAVLDVNIVEVGTNEYQVTSRGGDKNVYSVNSDLSMCDCKSGKEGRYCGHLAAVEKKFNLWVVTRPTLSDQERTLYAKIAFGSENVPRFYKTSNVTYESDSNQQVFEKSEVKCETEEYVSESDMPEVEMASSSTTFVTNTSSLDKEETLHEKEVVASIRKEFNRIVDLLAWSDPGCSSTLLQFRKTLHDVKTPNQAIRFATNNVKQHVSNKSAVGLLLSKKKNRRD